MLHESGPPPYVAVQTRRSLYVEYKNGWRELYNLKKDPWELNNIAGSARTKPLQAALSGDLARLYDSPADAARSPATTSIRACVRCAQASGTGSRRIPTGARRSGGPRRLVRTGSEVGDEFLLFDPLSVPDELRERATAVVLTAPYHERDARGLGLPVHTPPADTWQDWVEKFGIDPERVRGMESEDLAWLRAGEGEGQFHGPGEWPFGMTAYAGRETTTSSSGCRRSTPS
jgi:hypothetical protein